MGEQQSIYERSYEFARDVVRWCRSVDADSISRPLITQLVRSVSSVGANLQEAVAASSRKDFTNKVTIALRECRETHYWLRLLGDTDPSLSKDYPEKYSQEAKEISNILAKIIINSKEKDPA